MNVQQRQAIERQIAERVIDDALLLGYSITVFDGEETALKKSLDKAKILDAMFSTDEDVLYLSKDNESFGGIHFVYGNDGWDVIANYTDTASIQRVLKNADTLADKIEAEQS